ncbi:MAG: sugar ABC transporter permease [Actinomycetota bacterium]|nr:sugar ABC transporter permease [Actinomycetota bacterium]
MSMVVRKRRRIPWGAYLALAPTLGLLGFFRYYPDVNGLVHSFTNWEPGFASPFVGLANYRAMWHDQIWWQSFEHIGVIFLIAVTAMWAIPLGAAELLVTLSRPRWRFVFRTLLIVPLAFSPVIQVLTWEFIYDPNVGVLNHFLQGVGLGALAKNWLGDPNTALWALIFINFPWVAGLPFLIFSSGLQNIPREVFDAASVDGAGRLKRFFFIDLPMLMRQIRVLFFLAVVFVLQYGFAAFIATQGGPNNSTTVPVLRMVDVAFQADEWGYAAALSSTLMVIMMIVSGLSLLLGRKRGGAAR